MPAVYINTRDIPIGKLTRFPGNARRGDIDRIRESIRRHGQYRALVVRDTDDGLVILAGNHTHAALEAEGHTEARCEIIICGDDEARRINLADNRLAELGRYDEDALVELLSFLNEDYAGTGYVPEDVEDLHKLTTPPDLDVLAGEIGEPGEADGWPVIRVKVPPHVAAAWRSHADTHLDEVAAFAALLNVDPHDIPSRPWEPDLQATK